MGTYNELPVYKAAYDLLIGMFQISPIFEKVFINDSYSCRVDKGTHYGISRVDHFIRSCSQNYRKETHVLKLDIRGYFMAMDKTLLFGKIAGELDRQKQKINFD